MRLLRRMDKTGLLRVNFDPLLTRLLREVRPPPGIDVARPIRTVQGADCAQVGSTVLDSVAVEHYQHVRGPGMIMNWCAPRPPHLRSPKSRLIPEALQVSAERLHGGGSAESASPQRLQPLHPWPAGGRRHSRL